MTAVPHQLAGIPRRWTTGLASILALVGTSAAMAQSDTMPPPAAVMNPDWNREFVTSIRDRDGINVESLLDELDEAALPARRGSRVPVTAAAALATARKLTTVPLPPGSSTDPVALRAAATVAALANVPLAQAYLLEAERREPGNEATRISLATLLIAQGYPKEALALIGPTPPPDSVGKARGMNLRAGWYLTRGNGLLCDDRPAESVDPFDRAGKEDPFLSESARGAAKAHLMLGNRARARQAIRRASRQPQHVQWNGDGSDGELPWGRLYDLSRGRHRELVEITPPDNVQAVLGFLKMLSALQKEFWAAEAAIGPRLEAVANQKLAEGLKEAKDPGVASLVTGLEADLGVNGVASIVALHPLGNVIGVAPPVTTWDAMEPAAFSYRSMLSDWDPDIEATRRRDATLGQRQRETVRTMLLYMDEQPRQYQAFMKQMENLPDKKEPRCRAKIAAVTADLPTANALFSEHDRSLQSWFKAAWSIATAIASHAEGGDGSCDGRGPA